MGRVKTIVKYIKFDLQVSNGAVAMAKTTLEQLLVRCATPLKDEEKTEELLAAQDKSFHMVTHDLVREVTSPNSTVRKQAMHSLQVLAQVTGKSVTIIMEPHKEVGLRCRTRVLWHILYLLWILISCCQGYSSLGQAELRQLYNLKKHYNT